jgi:NADPH:quinone reductase-like Zn-dependent oxidoreductase
VLASTGLNEQRVLVMKSYEIHPDRGLELVDRPSPAVGPLDVRVRVRAVSLNYRDLVVMKGAKRLKKPLVPTSDGAGEVVAVGSNVTTVSVGDRVAASFFPTWLDGGLTEEHHAHALGGSIDGMLAEEVVLPETAWVKLPASLSFEQAATLPCAGVTAWNALFEAATLRPGDILLAQGTGGVSMFALQLARGVGANVVMTSSSAEKRERLVKMGAMATIDYRTTPKWGQAVRDATGGRGVDVAVEVGGAGTFDESISALRYGGTMSLLGILTGTAGPINTYQIFHKNIRVHGIYVGSARMFRDLLRAIEAMKIEPIIDSVFAFDQAKAAYDHLASGKHFGKVVVALS